MRGDFKMLLALFVVLTLGATYAITDSWFDYTDDYAQWLIDTGDPRQHNFWLSNATDIDATLDYDATREQIYPSVVYEDQFPTRRGASTGFHDSSAGATNSFPMGFTAVAGDLMIVEVFGQNYPGCEDGTWHTDFRSGAPGGNDYDMLVCFKLADGGETTYVFIAGTGGASYQSHSLGVTYSAHGISDVTTDMSTTARFFNSDIVTNPDPDNHNAGVSGMYQWLMFGAEVSVSACGGAPSSYTILTTMNTGSQCSASAYRDLEAAAENAFSFTGFSGDTGNPNYWWATMIDILGPEGVPIGYETDGSASWTTIPINEHIINYTTTFGNATWGDYLRVSVYDGSSWTTYSFSLDPSPFTEDMANITDVEDFRVYFRHPSGDTNRTPFLANVTIWYDPLDTVEPTWDGTAAGAWAGLMAVCGAFTFVWLSIRDKGKPLKSAKKFFKKGKFKL